jgi:hypothetical protein
MLEIDVRSTNPGKELTPINLNIGDHDLDVVKKRVEDALAGRRPRL